MPKNNKAKKHNYIFPDILARAMAKVDQRTQYEASMMSMSLMGVGLVLTMSYLIIYFEFPIWYKVILGINALAGRVFMWSYIVTTFQQYKNYMDVVDFQKQENEMKGGLQNAEENRS